MAKEPSDLVVCVDNSGYEAALERRSSSRGVSRGMMDTRIGSTLEVALESFS